MRQTVKSDRLLDVNNIHVSACNLSFDAREYLAGTHPLKKTDGDPWLLFVNNLARYRFHVVMIVIATALTIYGLASLLQATHAAARAASISDKQIRRDRS